MCSLQYTVCIGKMGALKLFNPLRTENGVQLGKYFGIAIIVVAAMVLLWGFFFFFLFPFLRSVFVEMLLLSTVFVVLTAIMSTSVLFIEVIIWEIVKAYRKFKDKDSQW